MNGTPIHVSKYSLFLMEQLIVILVFALCASVCVKIFTESYLKASGSRNLNYAMLAAENGAESFKASHGDLARTASALNGEINGGEVLVYYSEDWTRCNAEAAAFVMSLGLLETENGTARLVISQVAVTDTEGTVIFDITAAARAR